MSNKLIKCVVVGDSAVGKTSMLMSYTQNRFPQEHVPTVFENIAVTVNINNEPIIFDLNDTAGQEEFDRLRQLAYPGTNVFIVCYSVIYPDSFINLEERWLPEIMHHCPKTPFLIVGTKLDLREDISTIRYLAKNNQKPITTEEGKKFFKKIQKIYKENAFGFFECSALTQNGLKNVFDQALIAALNPIKITHKPCILL